MIAPATAAAEVARLDEKIRHAQSAELRTELRATRKFYIEHPNILPQPDDKALPRDT